MRPQQQAKEALQFDHPVYEFSPIPMIVLDQDRQVKRVNRAAAEFARHHPGAMVGNLYGEAFRCFHALNSREGCGHTPDCGDCAVRRTVLEAFEKGAGRLRVEARVPMMRGVEREDLHVRISTSPLEISGQPMVLVCLEDISELKQTEQALRAERDRAQRYLDVAEVILVAINDREEVTLINQKGCRVLGCTEQEIVGQKWFDTFVPASLREEVKVVFGRLVRGELTPIEYYENPIVTKWGEERLVAWHNALLTDETGRIVGTLSSGVDITESRKAEEERERLSRELEQKNKDLEMILRTIGHDLRTPLLNIQGFANRMARWWKQPQPAGEAAVGGHRPESREAVEQSIEVIRKSAARMDSLLARLLEFARLGRSKHEPTELEMNDLLTEIATSMAYQLNEADASLLIDELPACLAEDEQVSHIFANLIDNALKYRSPDRRCLIQVSGQIDGGEAVYCVQDNGIGIAPEHQEKVFQMSYRVQPGLNEGSGMGLAITRHLVERLGGRVWVESELGVGSRFFVALPASPSSSQS